MSSSLWKNSEDEALKVAVMKYGLNQWSRISSLFPQKSANQCKARWYEWLDPSIKKTEWTREEEEKLLHLAKIFPSQWRTIAPSVGRTPAQCIEHYERLLNQAQGKDEMNEVDPRRLKPGEIDPNPETRPARPDPIDMDEDEKEMLAELRVRITNTRGKKAKRIARTKMMEDVRRLAGTQKKRELKAAGIELNMKKTIKGINYNKEVPFERTPLEMGYQADESETPKPNLHLANISLQPLEGERRTTQEEAQRKLDEKKMKKLTERDLSKAVEEKIKLNSISDSNKNKLLLCAPQLKDNELEEMSKLILSQSKISVGKQAAQQIKSGLLGLPKPKNDYQIIMPELVSIEPELEKRRKLDTEDLETPDSLIRNKSISQSVRKNPTRLYQSNRQLIDSSLVFVPEENGPRQEAEQLLASEILRLVSRDTTFPTDEQDFFKENDLDEAAKLLRDEMKAIQASLKHGSYSRESLQSSWNEVHRNLIFNNDASQIYADDKSFKKENPIAFAADELKTKKERLDLESHKIEELKNQVTLLLGDYPKHIKQIQITLFGHLQDIDRYSVEQEVFKQLQAQEKGISHRRINELKFYYEQLTHKETELQRQHEKLIREKEEILKEPHI